jgi:hypothetical protein
MTRQFGSAYIRGGGEWVTRTGRGAMRRGTGMGIIGGLCAGLFLAAAAEADNVELVTFPGQGWSAVAVVRGGPPAGVKTGQPPPANVATFEVVSFAGLSITIVRGAAFPAAELRSGGAGMAPPGLDRIAFAVYGAESSHGADPHMWRAEPQGPQGPMQVTAAAALDIGGGDRFDLGENRALGRAYLARLFQHYRNWPDTVAAYNWGPGNLDAWIGGGRAADKLPPAVARYRDRVLRDAALVDGVSATLMGCGGARCRSDRGGD